MQAHVAGLLRALSAAPFASLKQIPVPPAVLEDSDTIECIVRRFFGGTPGNDVRLSEQMLPHEVPLPSAYKPLTRLMQVTHVRKTLANHFFDFSRYSQAAEFFSVLAQVSVEVQ